MAEVAHLFVALVHRFPVKEVAEAQVVQDKGFEGCIHGRPGSKRQVLLIDIETLERLKILPGAVKENVTTLGLDMQSLAAGGVLRIGESLLELTEPCHPCARMDEIRMGLREELRGQRGWLCRVVEGGRVARGDSIELIRVRTEAQEVGEERTGSAER
ncbi:MAG: MOSC domain-containing protein [Candidatus Acidiferrales bacterium]